MCPSEDAWLFGVKDDQHFGVKLSYLSKYGGQHLNGFNHQIDLSDSAALP